LRYASSFCHIFFLGVPTIVDAYLRSAAFFESSLLRIYIIARFGQMVCVGVQSAVHFSDAGCVDFAFVPIRNDYIAHP